jgi:hypothetical protein
MTRSTILTTASGRNVDLLSPRPDDIDFADIAEHLAKENRFNGATPDVAYSVAQHLYIGADAILEATRDPVAAAYFVLHDAHEAFLKDDTTPKKRAIGAIAEQFGAQAGQIIQAFDALTATWDEAIHVAAGLTWPMPSAIEELVHAWDRVMLLTEWRDLMKVPAPFDAEGVVLAGKITPQTWQMAEWSLKRRFAQFLPALKGKAEWEVGFE